MSSPTSSSATWFRVSTAASSVANDPPSGPLAMRALTLLHSAPGSKLQGPTSADVTVASTRSP
jgi:hypothetical protein